MHSIGHGTHPFVVTEQHCHATLNPIFGTGKDIVNCWLRRNLNGEALFASHRAAARRPQNGALDRLDRMGRIHDAVTAAVVTSGDVRFSKNRHV